MDERNSNERVIVLPYKDALLDYVIEPEDILDWMENPEIKEDLDKCLNELNI